MEIVVSNATALKLLESGYERSQKILEDTDKLEELLQKIEKKLKTVPLVGGLLSDIPIMISLVRNYVKKEYTEIPIVAIIAIISALLYWINPADLIPDTLPGIGEVDDLAVFYVCLKLIETDLQDYCRWREENGKLFDIPDYEPIHISHFKNRKM